MMPNMDWGHLTGLTIAQIREPQPPTSPFVLIRSCIKPVVFPTLEALARRILRDRGDEALELKDATIFRDKGIGRRAVAVWTQGPDGSRNRFLGHAWIDGAGWRVLQSALYAIEPNPAEREEAA